MKLPLMAIAMCLASTTAFAAAPGCIGGCMGSAPNPGNITLPAGYQCHTNWPLLPDAAVSCTVVNGPESNYTFTEIVHRDKNGHVTDITRERS